MWPEEFALKEDAKSAEPEHQDADGPQDAPVREARHPITAGAIRASGDAPRPPPLGAPADPARCPCPSVRGRSTAATEPRLQMPRAPPANRRCDCTTRPDSIDRRRALSQLPS